MKNKFLCFLLSLSLGAAALMPLAACGDSENDKGKTLSVSQAYGFGAVSAVRLLGGRTNASAVKSTAAQTSAAADGESGVKAQAEKFNEYFSALDSFLGDDVVTAVTADNPDTEYPYEKKMTVGGRNFEGESVEYVMYYTETPALQTAEEKHYTLTGVMLFGGGEYYLEGGRSEETEADESENELNIRAYPDSTDKANYVRMEQEYSEESGERETEYVYSVYENYELVEKTSVEFGTESKNGKTETEYELEFLIGGFRGKYEIERETTVNGVSQIEVQYNINGKRGAFVIREAAGADGRYEYTFADNSKLVF